MTSKSCETGRGGTQRGEERQTTVERQRGGCGAAEAVRGRQRRTGGATRWRSGTRLGTETGRGSERPGSEAGRGLESSEIFEGTFQEEAR